MPAAEARAYGGRLAIGREAIGGSIDAAVMIPHGAPHE